MNDTLLAGLGGSLIGAVAMVAVAWIGGLFKPSSLVEEIAALRESNRDLREQLKAARQESEEARKSAEACRSEVTKLQAELYNYIGGRKTKNA